MDSIKIRCSSIYRVTPEGKDSAGLTDKQAEYLEFLYKKEESPALTPKQQDKVKEFTSKKKENKITDNQLNELERLLLKESSPRLTDKQQNEKLELIAKRDYKPDFDLSEGAKTYIASKVEQQIYGYKKKIVSTLATRKGQYCEPQAIELYRNVNFRNKKYCKKNITRYTNNFLSG